jgi:hypothetical protein
VDTQLTVKLDLVTWPLSTSGLIHEVTALNCLVADGVANNGNMFSDTIFGVVGLPASSYSA